MRFNLTRTLGILTLVFGCLSVALLGTLPQYLKYKKGDIKDFSVASAGSLKDGDLIEGVIDWTEGCIATMESTNKTFGITTSKHTSSKYYAAYMPNGQCILYETGVKSQWDTLDRMGVEYGNFIDSYYEAFGEDGTQDAADVIQTETTMEFTGVVKPLSSDLKDIFQEWYGDDDAFSKETERVIISYSDFSRLGGSMITGIVFAVLTVILAVVTLIVWRRSRAAVF